MALAVVAQQVLLSSRYHVGGHAGEHLGSASAPFMAAAVLAVLQRLECCNDHWIPDQRSHINDLIDRGITQLSEIQGRPDLTRRTLRAVQKSENEATSRQFLEFVVIIEVCKSDATQCRRRSVT